MNEDGEPSCICGHSKAVHDFYTGCLHRTADPRRGYDYCTCIEFESVKSHATVREQITDILRAKLNNEDVPESATDQLSSDLKRLAQELDEGGHHAH